MFDTKIKSSPRYQIKCLGLKSTYYELNFDSVPALVRYHTCPFFAVGDVRSGSLKRVASGVGEGSVVVQAIHRFLNPGIG